MASMKSLLLFSLLLLCCCFRPIMCWRKFETADMVPKKFFDEQKSIFAFVERIIDGDTIRVRHIPVYNLQKWFKKQQPLQCRGISDQTLSIRIYGVDCPELSKRKYQKSQPFAETAKEFTSDLCLHKIVKITFLKRDQYRRAVAVVQTLPKLGPLFRWIPGLGPRDLSMELAKHGLAELYTGGGAVYWNQRDRLEKRIERAKRRGAGIWSQGASRISAEEHKKLQKMQPAVAFADTTNTRANKPTRSNKNQPFDRQTNKKNNTNQALNNVLEAAITGLEVVGV